MTTTREPEGGGVAVLIRNTKGEMPVRTATGPPLDVVDQWGVQSFPASDPPPTW
jgi:hypothetical protein